MMTEMNTTPSDLLTLPETVEFLGISKQTLYRILERGDLKGIKVGRQWRFNRADLERYLRRDPVSAALSATPPAAMDAALAALGVHADGATSEEKIARLVDALIHDAIRQRASDLHLEAGRDTTGRVTIARLRIDGVLYTAHRLPGSLHAGIVSRVRQIAGLNLDEHALPQDGRLRVTMDGGDYDIRVNIVPAAQGEGVVMRVIDQTHFLLGLDRLGFSPDDREAVDQLLRRPQGMVIVTGPIGSGKTTTLYSMLNALDRATRKIVTVEDPVELLLADATQVPVNVRGGLTFPVALRAMLRHDPDVIMVGEVRTLDTMEIAVQAAVTGHLVLAPLHAKDAAGALARLLEMGIEPFMITGAVIGVVAQTLIRRLCDACKQPAAYTNDELAWLGADAGELAGMTWYRPVGCPACGGCGYRGRLALFEVVPMTGTLAQRVSARAPIEELRAAAGTSLMRDGLRKACAGLVSLDDLARIVG